MTLSNLCVRPESASDSVAVDDLVQKVLGPGSKARAAYALRESISPEPGLSFVAELDDKLVGTVRQTRICWGEDTALMLGPLAVLQAYKNAGIGKQLMHRSVDAAREQAAHGGDPVIMLVGDFEYYERFGFGRIPYGKIKLPRPADPARILACELREGALAAYQGAANRWSTVQLS